MSLALASVTCLAVNPAYRAGLPLDDPPPVEPSRPSVTPSLSSSLIRRRSEASAKDRLDHGTKVTDGSGQPQTQIRRLGKRVGDGG